MLNLYDKLVMDAAPTEEKSPLKYYKHLGELKSDRTNVIILFRTVPREPESCLVIGPKFLSDVYRESLTRALESVDGQASFEFGTYLSRQKFPDGVEILAFLHLENYIKKISTEDVIVTYGPGKDGKIPLNKLNEMIAADMNMSLVELSIKDAPNSATKKNKKSNAKETAKN
jgi:hypothetical protein